MRSSKLKHGVIIAAAVAVLAIGTISASTAFAAKGGGNTTSGGHTGGGHGGHTSPTPTPVSGTIDVTIISPNPVPLGTAPTFHATGFQPGDTVLVMISGYMNGDVLTADSTGSITYTWWTAINIPGSYTFTAQTPDGRWGNVSFTVQ